jgi:hypothetical protein
MPGVMSKHERELKFRKFIKLRAMGKKSSVIMRDVGMYCIYLSLLINECLKAFVRTRLLIGSELMTTKSCFWQTRDRPDGQRWALLQMTSSWGKQLWLIIGIISINWDKLRPSRQMKDSARCPTKPWGDDWDHQVNFNQLCHFTIFYNLLLFY